MVDRLLPPTVSSLPPSGTSAAGERTSAEPVVAVGARAHREVDDGAGRGVDELRIAGRRVPSNSTLPLLTTTALPAVVLVSKISWLLLMMVELPAVEALVNHICPLFVMVALPAVPLLRNSIVPLALLVIVALPAVVCRRSCRPRNSSDRC